VPVSAARDDQPAPLYDYAKLRAWRDEAGLRREQVAVDLSISARWLEALEVGRKTPSVQMLSRLAAYYGHQAGELMMLDRPC
jgi:transcriptional regulator with XRE-family HTH domain